MYLTNHWRQPQTNLMSKDFVSSISVIINADDLGINTDVNEAIFDLLVKNQITSTTVLANGPRVKEAAARAHCFPAASFGAHLNLTEFEPLTCGLEQHLSTIRALRSRSRMMRLMLTPAILKAVYEEWCCQMDKLLSLGFSIRHIDSHHHIHTAPSLLPALKAVQRRYGVRSVRISLNLYPPGCAPSRALLISKRVFNSALRRIYATRTTDAFTDLVSFCKTAKRDSKRSYQTIEVMVHPGAVWANKETELLQSRWYETISVPVKLIPYWQL